MVLMPGEFAPGNLVKARVVEGREYDLVGEPVRPNGSPGMF